MKIRNLFLALALVPLGVLALSAATSQDKKPASAVMPSAWKIDNVHSAVIFKCKHMGVSWAYGRFNDFAGTVTFDAAKPESAKVDITIQAGSIDTNSHDRDEHMKSPDFLDSKQFPTATFKSKSVAKKDDHVFAVTGDFALHGVTKTVTIEMEHVGTADAPHMGPSIGFHGIVTIKRSDFGLKTALDTLGDEVQLTLSIEGHG